MPSELSLGRTGQASYLDKLLDQDITGRRRRAFETLCEKDCSREILGDLLVFLLGPKTLRLEADPKAGGPESVAIHLSPLDTQDALGGISSRHLRQIVSRAKRLASEVTQLRETPLVRHLAVQGAFRQGDLLYGSPIPNLSSAPAPVPSAFQGLLNLPDLAQQLGLWPERDRRIRKIYDHIRKRTGDWHDDLVVDLLRPLMTRGALKMFRSRSGLTGKRVVRSRAK